MSLADRVRDSASLRALAEASGVAWDLAKSAPTRGDWWAPCPFHAERTASFHVVEPAGRGGWFRCFGCGAKGSAIDFLATRDGLSVKDAIRRLASDAGLEREETPEARAARLKARKLAEAAAQRLADRRARFGLAVAMDIWRQADTPAPGDTLHRYLEARGVDLAALGGVPATLRLHPGLECRGTDASGARVVVHFGPAMVGLIGHRRPVGVHRTWIAPEGRARLADGRAVPKQWLGSTGRMMGQPVRLAPPLPWVILGEGIETTLAVLAACRAAGDDRWTAHAALSRDALAMAWAPPEGAAGVVVLGEGSARDPATARAKAEEARARLSALGLDVAVRVPGGRWDRDVDFADLAAAAGMGRPPAP